MTKVSYAVQVMASGMNRPAEFSDSENTPGAGSAAFAALQGKRDIAAMTAIDENTYGLVIIPYHAVVEAIVRMTVSEVEDPADATCKRSA